MPRLFRTGYLAVISACLLVEGADLTMREGKVHVRTVAGLKRADVIWRASIRFADPLSSMRIRAWASRA